MVLEENQQEVGGHDKVKKRTGVHGQSDDTWVVIDPGVAWVARIASWPGFT
jgi:hypothetical protein